MLVAPDAGSNDWSFYILRSVLFFLSLSILFEELHGEEASKQNTTSINFGLYHHRDALLNEVKVLAIRHPEIMQVDSLKSNSDEYMSEILVATVEHGVKGSTNDDKYRLLLSFGQHGRELITSEVALGLLEILVGENDQVILTNETIGTTFHNLIIKIIPMENYNGRKMVDDGDLCERKNGRGVDINRNWSVDWGKKEQDFDPAEEFPGTAPFSEPETRIMRDIAKTFKPHLWINVHSGMQALFMPYDYKNALPDQKIVQPMKRFLNKLNELHCNASCVIGPGGGSVGYLAHGTATDYMFEALEVPLAFTFEIYGDPEASNEDCFRMFNPTTPEIFESTITNWCRAFITILLDFETLYKSLPKFRNEKYQNSGSTSNVRKELMSAKEVQHTREQWNDETKIVFELIILVSIAYLGFISYILLKGQWR